MPFPVPENTSKALDIAIYDVNLYNETEANVYTQVTLGYQKIWGVSGENSGSVFSVEDIQDIMNAIGSPTVSEMMDAGGKLFDFLATYPGELPVGYLDPAFEFVVDAGQACGLRFTQLAPYWAPLPPPAPVV